MAGRHRKPTHTRRNLAAVTASGAFLLPLAGAAEARTPEPARANTGSGINWDVVARCESGNRNINNSGYPQSTASGYWQITNGTWRANGGTRYASRAIGASRAEQLAVAQRIAARRGSLADWNASRGCWGGKTGTTPGAVSAPAAASPPVKARKAPAPKTSAKGVTGKRAADGTGSYVCAPDKLYFEACDPHTLGTVQQYPPYTGRHRLTTKASPAAAPAAAAPAVSSGPSASRAAALLVSGARGYTGTPYRYGGTTRAGLDCSGLVWTVLRDLGLNPPRTSAAQYAWTRRISAAEAKPGDLVFFYSPVSHVGIYLGGGKMIDSSRPGTTVQVRTVYPGAKFGRIPA